ncbi:MAG: uracil-DNA glycosylase [Desulfosoma sp.]
MDHDQERRSLQATLSSLRLWGLREVLLPVTTPSTAPQQENTTILQDQEKTVEDRQEKPTALQGPCLTTMKGGGFPGSSSLRPGHDAGGTLALPGNQTFSHKGLSPRPSDEALPEAEREAKRRLLEEIRSDLGDCRRCPLHRGRTHIVFGEGDAAARLVFVGEGPGADEDQQGRPFVGQAGQLLNKMIHAMGLRRQEVYICNVVKCRPPGNRVPLAEEIRQCVPFLIRQLEAIRPQVICTLGACASQTLLGSTAFISNLRRKIHLWRGIPLIATYHPAYLLRNASKKADTWKDLQGVMELLQTERT